MKQVLIHKSLTSQWTTWSEFKPEFESAKIASKKTGNASSVASNFSYESITFGFSPVRFVEDSEVGHQEKAQSDEIDYGHFPAHFVQLPEDEVYEDG